MEEKNLIEKIAEDMEKEQTTRTFRVIAKEVKTDKNTFLSFSAYNEKVNEWLKLKFKKNCDNIIKEKGVYLMSVNLSDISVKNGKKKILKDGREFIGNDIMWVDKCELRKLSEEELKQEQVVKNKNRF